jgi:hypothetical protein
MKILLQATCFLLFFNCSFSQKITYATDGGLSTTKLGFNILGKINGKYFVHISHFNSSTTSGNGFGFTINASYIYVYNAQMQLVSAEKMPLPKAYFGLHFIAYPDFVYLFYQYTEDNKVFCMAAKIDSNGKASGQPVKLAETTRREYYANSSIYNIISSEDKKKIAIFTIRENAYEHTLSLILLNTNLKYIKKNIFNIAMISSHESFLGFNLDNEGNFVFLKQNVFDNSDPYKYLLNFIGFNDDSVSLYNATPTSIQLNAAIVKIDNAAKKVSFCSFYLDSTIKALLGDVALGKAAGKSGLFKETWDIPTRRLLHVEEIPFQDIMQDYSDNPELTELPAQNLLVGNIYNKSNGDALLQGVIISSENSVNEYQKNLSAWQNQAQSETEYLNYNSLDLKVDVILSIAKDNHFDASLFLLSFDSAGQFKKFDFMEDLQISGILNVNTGDAIHYLFIHKDKNGYSFNHVLYTAEGNIKQQPPLKNTGSYRLISFFSLQVSPTELIFPVLYNNKLNFARMEF